RRSIFPVIAISGSLGFVIFVGHSELDLAHYSGKHKADVFPDFESTHLQCDEGDCAVEQTNHIQKPASYVLGDDHRIVVVLRVALPLYIPILNGANNVTFVGRPQLNLDLVSSGQVGMLQKEVKTTRPGLDSFLVLQNELA